MEQYMKEYEEYKTLPPFWGWVVLIVFCLSLISFGMIAHMFILEPKERHWDFGGLPIAPGESRYTTFEPNNKNLSLQIEPYPGAYPLKKLSPDTSEVFSGECK
jgi:hypothetical protein